jgi:Flp pilus assembly pilin Flp
MKLATNGLSHQMHEHTSHTPTASRSCRISLTRPRKGGEVMLSFSHLRELLKRQEGQTMAEYAVIIAVILVGAAVAFGTMRDGILSAISGVVSYLPT